ncbi:MAG TPA: hypothetical protein VFV54_10000, partial [Thermoanaerobaculia bacterium]|nr:hypothetical protein [Thermoanaerobaculia bacterium]
AGASRWMARHFVASLMANGEISAGALLSLRDIGRFYFPLALTSVLSMAMGPVVTFGLGRARAPIESLAVWPVIGATAFLFRSGGVAFQEVGIALTGARRENARLVRATGGWLGLAASLALAALALTPLHEVWFQRISGLTPHLAEFAVWPVRILILLPLLEYVLAMQRARWILTHRTGVITVATAIEAAGTAIALVLTIGRLDLVGAVGGAIAMMAGRLAANAYLFVASRGSGK